MYHSFLIQSSAEGHPGCFHVLAIINSAVMNIVVHVSLSILISSLCMPSSGIAGSYGSYISSFFFFFFAKLICHRYTCVPHPEPSSLHPPHTIPLGHPSAPAPSIQYRALNLDWRLISYMILYIFQCHSPKSSHSLPLPQSPKDCSIYKCLFCCLVYRVIVTIFLNSIYMH